MAERRMFAKTIIDSDVFLDMPHSTQLLYFHLSMRADDDGFINNPKNIMRLASCKEDDLKLLIAKQFILPFESGIVVIKHWKIHNYIRSDRYKETKYLQEKAQLLLEENNSYTLNTNVGIPMVDQTDTQVRLGKNRLELDKSNIDNTNVSNNSDEKKAKNIKHKYGEYKHVMLKDEELKKLQDEYSNYQELITYLDEYIEMKGYKAKNHYLAIKKWVVSAVEQNKIRGGTYGTGGGIAKKNEFTEKNGKLYDSIGNEII